MVNGIVLTAWCPLASLRVASQRVLLAPTSYTSCRSRLSGSPSKLRCSRSHQFNPFRHDLGLSRNVVNERNWWQYLDDNKKQFLKSIGRRSMRVDSGWMFVICSRKWELPRGDPWKASILHDLSMFSSLGSSICSFICAKHEDWSRKTWRHWPVISPQKPWKD